MRRFSCDFCGNVFQDYESSRRGDHVFCTKSCVAKFRFSKAKPLCLVCGREVKTHRNIYCSRACSNKARWRKGLYNLPNPPKVKVEKRCEFCGEIFFVHPYRRIMAKFCSSKCWVLDLYRKDKFPFKETNIEKRMGQLLTKLGLKFTKQFILEGRIFDFYLCNQKILIECNGDYWHGNPEKFPVLDKRQKQHQENDEIKGVIAQNNGFLLLTFWGSDILEDIVLIEEEIKNACF